MFVCAVCSTKAAGIAHCSICGIVRFHPHSTASTTSPVLDLLLIEAGAFYMLDRGTWTERPRSSRGGFFTTRPRISMHGAYSAPVDRDTGPICDQTIALNGFLPHHPATRVVSAIMIRDRKNLGS
jgi:hypothetical protein